MKIVAASLETYADELKQIVQDFWKYDYVIVGGYAKEIIRQLNILKIFQIVHVEEFDDKYADIRICFGYDKEIPIRSYNAIFIKKGKVVAQVYLDSDTIPEINNKQSSKNIFINDNDPYDLENDLLDNKALCKEIKISTISLKEARDMAKITNGVLVYIIDDINDIKKQVEKEYELLYQESVAKYGLEKGEMRIKHLLPHTNYYAASYVVGKIYKNVVKDKYKTQDNKDIIYVEEKNVENVSN